MRVKVKPKRKSGLRPVCPGLIVSLSFVLAGLSPIFAQTPPPASPNGAALFTQHCAQCHGDQGQGISAIVSIAGPDIQAEHDEGQVLTAVEVGPSHMPSFARILSVQEMRAVSNFVVQQIAVIPLSAGDVSHGGILYRTYCAACHRTAVRGGALAFAGTNAPDLSEKSAAIIAGAIRSGPGPMPSFPPSVLDDKELSSVVAYVRAVQHPPNPGGHPMNWYGPVPEGLAAWTAVFALLIFTMWIERGGKG
jgi:ubiquinol-cytochrome c reductase cytochrome c subunit